MTSPSKIRAIFKYAFAKRLWFLILISLVFLFIFLDYPFNQWNELKILIKFWNGFISSLIGITTLFVALSVWGAELMQDWRNDLPKKLTVIFRYDGKEVMRCNRAELFSEADIRSLGQQIGRQMAGGGRVDLDFAAPSVKQTKKEISSDKETGFFMDYEVVFDLTELPGILKPERTELPRIVKPEKCLLWEPPFSEKPQEIPLPEL